MSTTIIVAAGIAVILAVVGWRMMRTARQPDQPTMYLYRCPNCGQKIRYAISRSGRKALCPRCKRRCILPSTPEPLPPLEEASRPHEGRRDIGLKRAV
jgi:DNA-directed RNA polymerase subunit RPC12/RpoP